jgi:hypothetical protein
VVCALVAACAALAWPAASPLVPGKGGLLAGERIWAWAFLACASVAFVAYLIGLLLVRRGCGLATVAALAAAIQLVPLGAPLLLSSDAWTYWDYGRLAAVHGKSPYVARPADAPGDPAFPYTGADWRDSSSVYGPAFTLASEPVALAAGGSRHAAAWIFKALAALAVLACALLAARLSPRPAFAAAFVGWNPLLALHFAGGGHNDAWMSALVLGALAAAARGRAAWAGAAWAAAVLDKWVPLLLLPLRLLEARHDERRAGARGFAAAAALLAAISTWRYGWRWVTAPWNNAGLETSFALPSRLAQVGLPHGAAVAALLVAFGLAYVWLLREASRGRARLGLATGLALLAVPYLAVWYVVWTVPLAAAEDDRSAQLLALGLCAYLLRQAIPL